jgi:hypothetical protein
MAAFVAGTASTGTTPASTMTSTTNSTITTGAETTKGFKPSAIEIPRTSSTNNDGPEMLSPRSWRGRGGTYQPPSRRQTNGTLDAEDYFVRLDSTSSPDGSS